jgi:hypothetical protein
MNRHLNGTYENQPGHRRTIDRSYEQRHPAHVRGVRRRAVTGGRQMFADVSGTTCAIAS